jgi:hypothetical protein
MIECQQLAMAVILQAVGDAIDPQARRKTRLEALDFLEGPGCVDWCQLAGVDAHRLRAITCRCARFFLQANPPNDRASASPNGCLRAVQHRTDASVSPRVVGRSRPAVLAS